MLKKGSSLTNVRKYFIFVVFIMIIYIVIVRKQFENTLPNNVNNIVINSESLDQMVNKREDSIREENPIEEKKKFSWSPKVGRKYVWIDVEMDQKPIGRIVAELYSDLVPKTAENFRVLVTGEKGNEFSYKNSRCHRIIKNFIVQCGDFTTGDGTGGKSIYEKRNFDDEINGLKLKHDKRYILQMANAGPNTNGSQFCFMLSASPHLNGKHVVFGQVIDGFEVVDQMEEAGNLSDGKPLNHNVVLKDGGEYLF